jgi:hypothetical protein
VSFLLQSATHDVVLSRDKDDLVSESMVFQCVRMMKMRSDSLSLVSSCSCAFLDLTGVNICLAASSSLGCEGVKAPTIVTANGR